MLLVIMLLVFVMMMATVRVATSLAQEIRRQREIEMIHRGTQYARAIKRYVRKFGRYPPTLEALEKTNNIRFLRQKYKDPMNPDGDWRILHLGEAKTLQSASAIPGIAAPAGGTAAPGSGAASTASNLGASGAGSATLRGAPAGAPPQAGTPASQMSSALGGKTFGGGPIVGVSSNSTDESIKELNGKNHYNDWEFVYDPRLDVGAQAGAINPSSIGAPTGQPANPAQPGRTGFGPGPMPRGPR